MDPAPVQGDRDAFTDLDLSHSKPFRNGNKGPLYFGCHSIDVDTGKVASAVGADQQVQKLKGKWLITNMAASSVTLTP